MTRICLTLLMFSLACGSDALDRGAAEVASTSAALTAPGCDPARRVGVPTVRRGGRGGVCPRPSRRSGWSVSYLFEQHLDVVADSGEPFCLYEYVGSPASFTTATLPIDPGTGRIGDDWTDADCLGVIPFAPPDPADIVTPAHVQASRIQSGRPEYLPVVGGLPETTRVAILDSSVNSGLSEVEPTTGEFLHGRAVSMRIREDLCPEGRGKPCVVDFDTYLVLDEGGDPNVPGGHYGSVASLAVALEEAIINASGDNLVIPLAVGWHPRFDHRNGDITEPIAQTVDAVRAILRHAVCNDVLVLAAAGNRTGSDDISGALCPACWEEHVVDCQDWRPMVYAIGGVGAGGVPLSISRKDGQPPLVAPADGISAENVVGSEEGPSLGAWTGTSMAVANAGAAAALVWSYLPQANPAEVMAFVRQNARLVAEQADVCVDNVLSNSCPPVAQITTCDALRAVLGPESPLCLNGGCPEAPCGAEPDVQPELSNATIALLQSLANPDLVTEGRLDVPVVGTACSQSVFGNGVLDPNQLYCGWETVASYASEPQSLDAQPGSSPCGACALIKGDTDQVYMAINHNMIGYLSDPVLEVPSYGYVALADTMPPNTFLAAGDIASVPLAGLDGHYGNGAHLSFVWQKTLGAPQVQVSVEIPVYY